MKKYFLILLVGLSLVLAAQVQAYELQFRNGPVIGVKNSEGTQYKLGINFAGTSKGQESGFYTSTSIDVSVLENSTVIWLQPEFQYDFKLGGLPLYIYPKIGVLILFGWYPFDYKAANFGVEFGAGVKFDIFESLYVWCEPFNMDMLFARYQWSSVANIAAGTDGWNTTTQVAYELLFGVGFRL